MLTSPPRPANQAWSEPPDIDTLLAQRVDKVDLSGTPLADVQAVVLLDLATAGQWLLSLDHGRFSYRRVVLPHRTVSDVLRRGGQRRVVARRALRRAAWPDTLVRTDATTMAGILEGERSGVDAFLDGDVAVRGNLGLLLQLDSALYLGEPSPRFPRAHVVEALGARTAYLEAGSPDAPPVILVHGLGSSNSSMLPLLRGLAQDYRVIAPDTPGFGASDAPRWIYDAPQLGRWLAAFQQAVAAHPSTLVGNSLGGRIALETALLQPDAVDRLVLLCPSPAFLRRRQFQALVRLVNPDVARVRVPLRGVASRGLRAMFAVPDRLSNAACDAAIDEFCRVMSSPAHRRACLSATCQIYVEEAYGDRGFWDRLPRLACPTLFVWGERDRLVPPGFARHAAAAVPSAESLILPDCGHVPQFEHPEQTLALVRDFIGRAAG